MEKEYRKAKKPKAKRVTTSSAAELNKEHADSWTSDPYESKGNGIEHASDLDIASPPKRASRLSPKIRILESVNMDVPFLEQFHPDDYEDSRVAARELFKLLIHPLEVEQFYE